MASLSEADEVRLTHDGEGGVYLFTRHGKKIEAQLLPEGSWLEALHQAYIKTIDTLRFIASRELPVDEREHEGELCADVAEYVIARRELHPSVEKWKTQGGEDDND